MVSNDNIQVDIYKSTQIEAINNAFTGVINNACSDFINWLNDIPNMAGLHEQYLIKMLKLDALNAFDVDSKLIFNNLSNSCTLEGLINLLRAVFNSNEITIDNRADNNMIIDITVINHNAIFSKLYIDNNSDYYINNSNFYAGALGGDFLGLEGFFKQFYSQFLIAGMSIGNFTIIVNNNEVKHGE